MLLSICNSLKAQTCAISLTFSSQADIDNFAVNNPGCTSIDGDVLISGRDILNLDGLSSITNISGFLLINDNLFLNSLAGLSAVTHVGGEINIEMNSSLPNLTGLENLSSIGSSLRIVSNLSLVNISALGKITSVNGFLSVGANPYVASLSGLENITTINGPISIALNNRLKDMDGLSGLTSINGYIFIIGNRSLISLTGLTSLTSLFSKGSPSIYITISENNALTTLSGLDNIDTSPVGYLKLENSTMLSYCGVKSICNFLSRPNTNLIRGNATGCNNQVEISSTAYCMELPVTLINFQGKNTPEGNTLTWQTTSETINYGFEIERSLNAKTFVKAGFIEGNGDTNETKSYSFTDIITEPVVYYRLKQIDFDQKFSYSRIIIIKGKDKEALTKIYPNPADKQLFIETNNKNQSYQLVNEQGIILEKASSIPPKPLDIGKLANGVYILNIGKESHKVLIAR